MARFELPIYGKDDEVIKLHEANRCPWGVYIQAADMQERLKSANAREQMDAVGEILKGVFPDLTDEDLFCADAGDVINTFTQIVNGGQQIKGGAGKNAPGAKR